MSRCTAASGPIKYAAISAADSGDNTLVAAVTGSKIRVLSLFMEANGTVTARFESGAGGTALTGQIDLDNTGAAGEATVNLGFNPVGWFETASGALLNLELGGAVECAGCLVYQELNVA